MTTPQGAHSGETVSPAMLLDFDPTVVGIASQPFWLSWTAVDGRSRSHVPDYFARRTERSAVGIDCRPVDRRDRPRDVAAFEATRCACAEVGWEHRLVGAPDSIMAGNVRWLAGYRHSRHYLGEVAGRLREVFTEPAPLTDGAEAVGDPIAVLPVVFHLRPGDWVCFDAGEHQVVALAGTSVRLRSSSGTDEAERVLGLDDLRDDRGELELVDENTGEVIDIVPAPIDGGALAMETARFRDIYNRIRPHQALGDRTPRQAYLDT